MSHTRRGSSSRFGGRASRGSNQACMDWTILTVKVILILMLLVKLVFIILLLVDLLAHGSLSTGSPNWAFYFFVIVLFLSIIINIAIIGMIACECVVALCVTIIVYLFLLVTGIVLQIMYGDKDKDNYFTSGSFVVTILTDTLLIVYNVLLCFG